MFLEDSATLEVKVHLGKSLFNMSCIRCGKLTKERTYHTVVLKDGKLLLEKPLYQITRDREVEHHQCHFLNCLDSNCISARLIETSARHATIICLQNVRSGKIGRKTGLFVLEPEATQLLNLSIASIFPFSYVIHTTMRPSNYSGLFFVVYRAG